MNAKYPFTFGRIVIDLKHQFFGKLNPSAFVVADMWANEEDGDEDVWCDHYRGHIKIPFSRLHEKTNFKVMDIADFSKDVHQQCKDAEIEYERQSKSKES